MPWKGRQRILRARPSPPLTRICIDPLAPDCRKRTQAKLRPYLERLVSARPHGIEKETLRCKDLEHVIIEKV